MTLNRSSIARGTLTWGNSAQGEKTFSGTMQDLADALDNVISSHFPNPQPGDLVTYRGTVGEESLMLHISTTFDGEDWQHSVPDFQAQTIRDNS